MNTRSPADGETRKLGYGIYQNPSLLPPSCQQVREPGGSHGERKLLSHPRKHFTCSCVIVTDFFAQFILLKSHYVILLRSLCKLWWPLADFTVLFYHGNAVQSFLGLNFASHSLTFLPLPAFLTSSEVSSYKSTWTLILVI